MRKLNTGRRPKLYVIAGPNGAGKTTFARKFLPKYARCFEFVNADLIAGGLSPFTPERVAVRAGRIMIDQIRRISAQRLDFGFETTLSGKSYLALFQNLKKKGYRIHLFYLWVVSADLALERIAERVRMGAMMFRQTQSVADLLKGWPILLDYIGHSWILGTFMIIQWRPQSWSPSRDPE